ncbi:hypothetical protein LEP1GSC086_2475 [Leptospira weilii str. LNT 1234]|nr:hypothetical protein LEP1GSC086_2475 [Leptospira weilii str. LNT 1234]
MGRSIDRHPDRSIGSQSFRIAKSILNKGIQVIVLNPGDLATIYQSLKKTDKEGLLKIARLIQRYPKEEFQFPQRAP